MSVSQSTGWSKIFRRAGGPHLRHALSYAPRALLPLGRGFRQARAELRESEYWPADRLREFADARLRRLITYAAAHVPYYRELFAQERLNPREIQGVRDLSMIPLLTKEILSERFEDLKSDQFSRHRPISHFLLSVPQKT